MTLDCGSRIDLLVEHTVIVELKAGQELTAIHEAQIFSDLKLSGCPVGLLINFHVRQLTEGIKRLRIGMDVCRGPAWNSLRDLCLLTFKIFEACADFLTPDGLGSCSK